MLKVRLCLQMPSLAVLYQYLFYLKLFPFCYSLLIVSFSYSAHIFFSFNWVYLFSNFDKSVWSSVFHLSFSIFKISPFFNLPFMVFLMGYFGFFFTKYLFPFLPFLTSS